MRRRAGGVRITEADRRATVMSHFTVAFYIAVKLAGFWIVVLAFLSYHRGRNPAHLFSGLFFAPMIGISVYTNLARYPSFGRRCFQVSCAVVAEVLLTYNIIKLLFAAPAIETADHAGHRSPTHALSAREHEIARLVSNGYTNREIAETLRLLPTRSATASSF
jgi:hypothetical protein